MACIFLQFAKLNGQGSSSGTSTINEDRKRHFGGLIWERELEGAIEAKADCREAHGKGCSLIEVNIRRKSHGDIAFADDMLCEGAKRMVEGIRCAAKCQRAARARWIYDWSGAEAHLSFGRLTSVSKASNTIAHFIPLLDIRSNLFDVACIVKPNHSTFIGSEIDMLPV